MNEDKILELFRNGFLRKREVDPDRVKSMIRSSENAVEVVKKIPLNEKSATVIFREIYESVRQLGEAQWWLKGYEPFGLGSHNLSLDILKDFDINHKIKLNHLDRFKKIRHDANYRGMMVSISQAKEIIEFWEVCGREILEKIKNFI